MSSRNLFLIGRRRGSEDQLTEMLAYLWERRLDLPSRWLENLGGLPLPTGEWSVATQVAEPGVGRFDLVLQIAGTAVIVIESKLDSPLTHEQLVRYLEHIAPRSEPLRALVALTKGPQPPDAELARRAEEAGVIFVATRWQALAEATADPFEEGEAGTSSACSSRRDSSCPTPSPLRTGSPGIAAPPCWRG